MTVNELRAALDKLVAERPECGEFEAYAAVGLDPDGVGEELLAETIVERLDVEDARSYGGKSFVDIYGRGIVA